MRGKLLLRMPACRRPARMNDFTGMGLGGLFLSAFTSATLLPGSSEVLLGMAVRGGA